MTRTFQFTSFPFQKEVLMADENIFVGPNGFYLKIPANAMTANTTVNIAAPRWSVGAPRNQTQASYGYQVSARVGLIDRMLIYIPYEVQFQPYRSSLLDNLSSSWVSDCDPGVWQPNPQVADRPSVMGMQAAAFGMFVVMKP